jgi:hypothetical protein
MSESERAVANMLMYMVTEPEAASDFADEVMDGESCDAVSYEDAGVLTRNAGFEMTIGTRTYQVSVVEK